MDIFSYSCALYAELIKHSLVSYPLKVWYTSKVPLRSNSTVIIVVVAVGVEVAVAVGVVVLAVGVVTAAVGVLVAGVVTVVVWISSNVKFHAP